MGEEGSLHGLHNMGEEEGSLHGLHSMGEEGSLHGQLLQLGYT